LDRSSANVKVFDTLTLLKELVLLLKDCDIFPFSQVGIRLMVGMDLTLVYCLNFERLKKSGVVCGTSWMPQGCPIKITQIYANQAAPVPLFKFYPTISWTVETVENLMSPLGGSEKRANKELLLITTNSQVRKHQVMANISNRQNSSLVALFTPKTTIFRAPELHHLPCWLITCS